jgi:predicted dinucleotide-utilizing enzyme
MRVGIVGLGAIGRAMCEAIDRREVDVQLAAVTTRRPERAQAFLCSLRHPPPLMALNGLIERCDFVIEAATQEAPETIAPPTLQQGKDLMVFSVGALLEHDDWPQLARQTGSRIYVPLGAIVGPDGVKGAAIGRLTAVTMTTRKPPQGLDGASFVVMHQLDLAALTEETVIFEGRARGGRHASQRPRGVGDDGDSGGSGPPAGGAGGPAPRPRRSQQPAGSGATRRAGHLLQGVARAPWSPLSQHRRHPGWGAGPPALPTRGHASFSAVSACAVIRPRVCSNIRIESKRLARIPLIYQKFLTEVNSYRPKQGDDCATHAPPDCGPVGRVEADNR